jgi:hypothetical protein
MIDKNVEAKLKKRIAAENQRLERSWSQSHQNMEGSEVGYKQNDKNIIGGRQ